MTRSSLVVLSVALTCCFADSAAAQNSSLLHSQHHRNHAPGQMSLTQPLAPAVEGVTSQHGVTSQGWPARPASAAIDGQFVQLQPPLDSIGPLDGVSPGATTGEADPGRPRITISEASWTYQPPPPMRVFRKNDLVTIRVDEITRVMAEGSSENRKRTLYEAILTDWIRLSGFKLRPDPQVEGDPTVGAESNANFRAESTVESRESLTFNIAATVVDIRSNGMLVLEGTKTIRVNDNLWETAISGMCRAQDVGPDNVVLTKDLIDLEIKKQDRGHLRDGYKRGWFQRAFDRVQPF